MVQYCLWVWGGWGVVKQENFNIFWDLFYERWEGEREVDHQTGAELAVSQNVRLSLSMFKQPPD